MPSIELKKVTDLKERIPFGKKMEDFDVISSPIADLLFNREGFIPFVLEKNSLNTPIGSVTIEGDIPSKGGRIWHPAGGTSALDLGSLEPSNIWRVDRSTPDLSPALVIKVSFTPDIVKVSNYGIFLSGKEGEEFFRIESIPHGGRGAVTQGGRGESNVDTLAQVLVGMRRLIVLFPMADFFDLREIFIDTKTDDRSL